MKVPAIRNECGTLFASPIELNPGAPTMSFVGCGAGPCPSCAGDGSIPDGIYNFIGNTIQILSDSSRTRAQLQRLAAVLTEARQSKMTANELDQRLRQDLPELSSICDALPRTRNELYAFLAIVLTIITMLLGRFGCETEKSADVTVNQVINNIYEGNASN